MMLNAMAPQRHHQQAGAGASPLLLSTTGGSSVATTLSTSPSSSSSASSSHQSSHTNTSNRDNHDHSQPSTTAMTTTTTASPPGSNTTTHDTDPVTSTTSSNTNPQSPPATAAAAATPTTTTSHQNHHHHQHHHPQHHHHHHNNHHFNNNNSYHPQKFNNHHHSSHHHNMSYAARSSNSQRGHSHNHQNHHNPLPQQQQQPTPVPATASGEANNIPVTSPAATEAVSSTTSSAVSQRQQQQPISGPPYYVDLHVNAGECVSLQLLDGQEQVVAGPATITMISQQQNPPVPIPVQVPPGHMIHQIADENGTLKHIILSVMDTDESAQLDSTVITLPQGTFRIDSHGELVSTGGGADGCPLTTLPQQAYFANYDGCPVAYDATVLPDYQSQNPHQPYNSPIVAAGHHHQQHYHQPADVGSTSPFKSQALLPPNQGVMMGPGNYSPAYSNYNHVPTTLAAVVSSNNPVHGGGGGGGGGGGSSSAGGGGQAHQQQQQQPLASTYRTPESDNYMQRTREPVSYSHTNNNYGPASARSQHNNENSINNNNGKRGQNPGDKSNSNQQQQQHNNRYATANVNKVIGNNHLISSPTGNSSRPVSPIRARMKGNSSQSSSSSQHLHHHNNHHHQSNGVRSNHHYNSSSSNTGGQMHDTKEDSGVLSIHPVPAAATPGGGFHHHGPRDHGGNHHGGKGSKNIYCHDHNSPALPKHINNSVPSSAGGHCSPANQHKGGAWQPGNRFIHQGKNNSLSSECIDDSSSAKNHLVAESHVAVRQHGRFKGSSEALENREPVLVTDRQQQHHHQQQQQGGVVDRSESKDGKESFDTRSSRGKQKKCQTNQASSGGKSQSTDLQTDRRKQNEVVTKITSGGGGGGSSSNRALKLGPLNSEAPVGETDGGEIASAYDKQRMSSNSGRSDSKSRATARDGSLKRGKGAQKRANLREKSSQPASAESNSESSNKSPEFIGKETDEKDSVVVVGDESTSVIESPIGGTRTEARATSPSSTTAAFSSKQQSNESSPKGSSNANSAITTATTTTTVAEPQQTDSQQHKHKSRHNSGSQAASTILVKNEPLARNGSKKASSSKTDLSPKNSPSEFKQNLEPSPKAPEMGSDEGPAPVENLKSRLNAEIDDNSVLVVTRAASPALPGSSNGGRKQFTISMRTSLSENNIQLLDSANSSVKSTQTSPQKANLATITASDNLAASPTGSIQSVGLKGSSNEMTMKGDKKRSVGGGGAGDKRKGVAVTKSENQQVRLSSVPQLKLLNLNCTSVTSSSVQLRWSYVPSLAEKYGINHHQHPGSKNSILMDHFVIEAAGSRNAETNALLSPKIVYQGCAFSCRVSHLSPDKIHHFKVRRTALLTAPTKVESAGIEPDLGGSGSSSAGVEHLVVSEILSVTLPSVPQQPGAGGKKGSSGVGNGGRSSNQQQQRASIEASSFDSHHHGHESSGVSHHLAEGTSNAYRGNTSSHSNSNHGSGNGSNSKSSFLQPIKLSNLLRQCRTKSATMLGKLVQNSLSSCSDTKFAGFLLILFTIFAMLLAIFIHLYIVAPVTE